MPSSAKDRRERAAQARASAEAGAKRRERLVRIIGGAVVGLLVVGIIGVAWVTSNSEREGTELVVAEPDPNAPLPAGVLGSNDPYAYGVVYGSANDTAPAVEIWEDMQCPACGDLEAAAGPSLAAAAESGDIRLIWRPVAFLDRATDASTRAIAAWGCAIDAGKTREYHDRIYADQPQAGEGWTDEQLLQYGAEVGLVDDAYTAFEDCVRDRRYVTWGANSTAEAVAAGVQSTPTVLVDGSPAVNGEEARVLLLTDPVNFLAALRAS
jgi:protein-disulfide isomerase